MFHWDFQTPRSVLKKRGTAEIFGLKNGLDRLLNILLPFESAKQKR